MAAQGTSTSLTCFWRRLSSSDFAAALIILSEVKPPVHLAVLWPVRTCERRAQSGVQAYNPDVEVNGARARGNPTCGQCCHGSRLTPARPAHPSFQQAVPGGQPIYIYHVTQPNAAHLNAEMVVVSRGATVPGSK